MKRFYIFNLFLHRIFYNKWKLFQRLIQYLKNCVYEIQQCLLTNFVVYNISKIFFLCLLNNYDLKEYEYEKS